MARDRRTDGGEAEARSKGRLMLYLLRRSAGGLVLVGAGMAALLLLAGLVDAAQGDRGEGALFPLRLALLSLPSVFEEALPAVAFLSALLTLGMLQRRGEVAAARALGLSQAQILAPAAAAALLAGGIALALLNPSASALLRLRLTLEAEAGSDRVDFRAGALGEGFWLRQGGGEGGGDLLMRSGRASEDGALAEDVTLLRIRDGRVVEHVRADRARLEDGAWALEGAWVIPAGGQAEAAPGLRVPTPLTTDSLHDRRAGPETVPLWRLPALVRLREEIGASSLHHRYRLHFLIASPFILAAAAALGAALPLALRPAPGRGRASSALWIAGAALALVCVHGAVALGRSLAVSRGVPPVAGAWAPAAVLAALSAALFAWGRDA